MCYQYLCDCLLNWVSGSAQNNNDFLLIVHCTYEYINAGTGNMKGKTRQQQKSDRQE